MSHPDIAAKCQAFCQYAGTRRPRLVRALLTNNPVMLSRSLFRLDVVRICSTSSGGTSRMYAELV